jgi:hypothetical protein
VSGVAATGLTVLTGTAILFVSPVVSRAQGPDFHVVLETCKTTIGYHGLADESLKISDGEPIYNACTRRSRKISCALRFQSGDHGVKGRPSTTQLFSTSRRTFTSQMPMEQLLRTK